MYMQCTYPSLNSKNAHPKDVNIPVVAVERVCMCWHFVNTNNTSNSFSND